MNNYRSKGKEIISKFLSKSNNINILEKYISNASGNEEEYCENLFEALGIYSVNKNLKSVLELLYQDKLTWNNDIFTDIREKQDERDQFIVAPFEVEEGVLECGKCGSRKTISFQRQTRSADEGATTFAQCMMCKNKWRHNN